MVSAKELRVGNVVKLGDRTCRVLSVETRGAGKSGKIVHSKLRNLDDGHMIEQTFQADEKIQDVDTHRVKMQYVYKDGNQYIFMNSENYEQFPVQESLVGEQSIFLKENSEIDVLFADERPVAIEFPKIAELKVTTAPPAAKGGHDKKEVELENGLKILVPQFVKEGETVRVNVEDLSYHDRVTTRSMGGGAYVEPEKGKKE